MKLTEILYEDFVFVIFAEFIHKFKFACTNFMYYLLLSVNCLCCIHTKSCWATRIERSYLLTIFLAFGSVCGRCRVGGGVR